jgi:hypothetical protein
VEFIDGNIEYKEKVVFPFIEFVINDKLIYIPQCYINDDDFETSE